jgi:photosystem II stability/assembly factor-like uncharacterized protein
VDPIDERADAVLGQHFASYRARTLARVRPAGSGAARRAYDRRQQRRLVTVLATIAALVLTVAGGAYALVERPDRGAPGGGHPTADGASRTSSPGTGESPHPGPSVDPGGDVPEGPAGGPVPPGFQPVSVTFINTTSAWLLGSAPCLSPRAWSRCPAVLRSQDGGSTWVGVPAPGDAAYVGDIRFADARNGWVVVRGPLVPKDPGGTSGILYATHDGGATWHTVPVPGAARVEAAAGRVWVTSRQAPQPSPAVYSAPVGGDAFTRVDWTSGTGLAVHGRYAYVYGGGVDGGEQGDTLSVVKDGVVTARKLPCSGDHAWSVVLAASADVRLAAVCGATPSGTTQPKQAFVSVDAGASWIPDGTPDAAGLPRSLAAIGPATFLAGSAMPIRVTRDAGRTWPVALAAPGSGGFGYVGFTDDTHGVAVPAGGSAVYLTADGGRTWSAQQFL